MKQVDWDIVKVLPTDYHDYGGEIERWADTKEDYPDCSCGCKYFLPIEGELGFDWGVCGKSDAPRAGLLTFEHQAGKGCFEYGEEEISGENIIQEMINKWKWDNN
jgi:hypothetical protein